MLVTLSLSTVVVAFGYMAYNYMFSSFIQYEKMNAEISETVSCQRQMQKLFNRCESAKIKERTIIFQISNSEEVNIQFGEQHIVFYNKDFAVDTVKCLVKDVKGYLSQKEINAGYIDAAQIEIELNKTPYSIRFEKLYDSEKMMILDSLNTFAGTWQK